MFAQVIRLVFQSLVHFIQFNCSVQENERKSSSEDEQVEAKPQHKKKASKVCEPRISSVL